MGRCQKSPQENPGWSELRAQMGASSRYGNLTGAGTAVAQTTGRTRYRQEQARCRQAGLRSLQATVCVVSPMSRTVCHTTINTRLLSRTPVVTPARTWLATRHCDAEGVLALGHESQEPCRADGLPASGWCLSLCCWCVYRRQNQHQIVDQRLLDITVLIGWARLAGWRNRCGRFSPFLSVLHPNPAQYT